MATFLPLKELRNILDDARKDLKNIRETGASLQRKIAGVNKPEFSREHVVKQVGLLRESARAEAGSYLSQARTLSRLASVKGQGDHWNLGAFLARATIPDASVTGDALIRHLIFVQTLPTYPTEALAAMLQPAIDAGNWGTVAQVYLQAQSRTAKGDPDASSITASVSERSIPEIAEARGLIAQARQVEEFTTYSLRSIQDGSEDLGVKMEGYQQQWNEREAAKLRDAA